MIVSKGYDRLPSLRGATGGDRPSVDGVILSGRACPEPGEVLIGKMDRREDRLFLSYGRQDRVLKRGCKRTYVTEHKVRFVECELVELEGATRWSHVGSFVVKT